MKIKVILSLILLSSTLCGFAQKSSLKEYVADIPEGRNILTQPHFTNKEHVNGHIAIDFIINKKGDVISAIANKKHTTIRNMNAIRQCEQAVMEAKFSKQKHGPDTQHGSVAFAF